MLTNLRDWLTRRASRSAPPGRALSPEAAQQARESRASLVAGLHAEVRQLQQDMADLNRDWDDGTDQSESEVATARLRALEEALDRKQAELAKLQGRI
jgi:hypothetical protein